MLQYKGAYSGDTSYAAGDIVVYTDNVAYHAFKTPPSGTVPHDQHYWERVIQPFQEIVLMFHGYLGTMASSIPDNIDDEGIVLKTDDGEYLITVDDSDDTPELSVTAVTEGADT